MIVGKGEQYSLISHKAPAISHDERVELILDLARVCKKQNSYQLACKKFTQAGDRARALSMFVEKRRHKNIIYRFCESES